jgi:methyl-accepting chemotaxis protein
MKTLSIIAIVQTPASLPDTVALAIPSGFLSTAEAVSTIILTLVVLGVLVALIGVLLQLRKLARSVGEVTKRLEKDAGPVLERAKSVMENVDFITAAVRSDVQKLNDSVARLNDRLKQASERMEERIQDFTALVEVLQSEAEELALDTAAAVRGVRAGTRTLAGGEESVRQEEEEEALPLLTADEKIEG